MDDKKIKEAVKLAREFIELANEMFAAELQVFKENEARGMKSSYVWPSPKHRGAVRRRSMDLTRALADMRRPR